MGLGGFIVATLPATTPEPGFGVRRRTCPGGGERVNRMVGVGLTAVLVASLVGVGTWQAVNRPVTADASPPSTPPPDPITVQGIVGTEKREFFADPAVQQRLAALA